MAEKVNLAEKLARIDGYFLPGIVGYLNDYKIQVGKIRGEFVWHSHPDTDDFFLIEPKGTPNVGDADAEPAPEVEL